MAVLKLNDEGFASYNVKRGIIEAEIRRATGHKDSKSFIRYIVFGTDED